MIKKIPKDTACFHFYNANPSGNRAADCVIRAISLAFGQSWDTTLDELVELAHIHKLMPNERKCYEKLLASKGFIKMPQPRKANNKKYTGKQFCKTDTVRNNKVVVISIGGHHISVIVDGKINDIWDCSDSCIGNYWTLPENVLPL